jgi:Protein of unknown function (DUF3237)
MFKRPTQRVCDSQLVNLKMADSSVVASLKDVADLELTLENSPAVVDNGLLVINVPGGTMTGEGLKGDIISPSVDWLKLDGAHSTLDVRLLIKMDDDSILYASYNGRGRFGGDGNVEYVASTPLFRTTSEKYAFLKNHQYLMKMSCKMPNEAEDGFIKYKVYRVD